MHIQGTGLGMSIAQGIVEAMQGSIQAESEKGKGSRFTVTLNLRISEEDEGLENIEDARLTGKSPHSKGNKMPESDWPGTQAGSCTEGVHLLLVEDNVLNLEIAKTLLEELGFTVHSAKDGLDALKMFSASEAGTYQAILMDQQMPVMDGYASAREIRRCGHSRAQKIPIIALTANAFAEDITKALASGMNDHVFKPIDYQRLAATLRDVIQ